jgi:hypothetical protein
LTLDRFELYDEKNERLCICRFVKNYEKNAKLDGYFSEPVSSNTHKKVFSGIVYLRRFSDDEYKKLSTEHKMDNIFISDVAEDTRAEQFKPIVSVEDFFFDDPAGRYQALPTHNLQQSPCAPIIGSKTGEKSVLLYYCKLHPKIQNLNLDSIEHHCKYGEPEVHKKEILSRLSKSYGSTAPAA